MDEVRQIGCERESVSPTTRQHDKVCDEGENDRRDPPRSLTILHAEHESVEVNMAPNPSAVYMFFRMIKAKERELLYQKEQLEGCKMEVQSLQARIEIEKDPSKREKLIEMSKNIATAVHGKKEFFLARYQAWRNEMVTIEQELRRHGLPVEIPLDYRPEIALRPSSHAVQ